MKSKLEALVKRIDVLNTELSHEDVTKDMERYKKISKEHSDITPIVEIYKKFQKITLDTASVLLEAIDLYEKMGFKEIEASNDSPRCDRAFELVIE